MASSAGGGGREKPLAGDSKEALEEDASLALDEEAAPVTSGECLETTPAVEGDPWKEESGVMSGESSASSSASSAASWQETASIKLRSFFGGEREGGKEREERRGRKGEGE